MGGGDWITRYNTTVRSCLSYFHSIVDLAYWLWYLSDTSIIIRVLSPGCLVLLHQLQCCLEWLLLLPLRCSFYWALFMLMLYRRQGNMDRIYCLMPWLAITHYCCAHHSSGRRPYSQCSRLDDWLIEWLNDSMTTLWNYLWLYGSLWLQWLT